MKSLGIALVLLSGCGFLNAARGEARAWEGAWRAVDGEGVERVLLIVDGYWTQTMFTREEPAFHRTWGGPFEVEGDRAVTVVHFDSGDAGQVGRTLSPRLERRGDETLVWRGEDGTEQTWERVRDGGDAEGELAGVWRISGRQRDNEIQAMPLRARRTLKVLVGGRFQWIAMNIETGEFSGTGGGRYTFEDGTYTEVIEFFSRDASRVGAELSFEGRVEGGDWHHRGLSSRGDPIYEVWTKVGGAD